MSRARLVLRRRLGDGKKLCRGCGNVLNRGSACPNCFDKVSPTTPWPTSLNRAAMNRKTDMVIL